MLEIDASKFGSFGPGTESVKGNLDRYEVEALQEILGGRDAWRLTPATFATKVTNGRWKSPKHLRLASTAIASGLIAGNARMVFSFPPRHGKSELLSVNTPQWILDRWPHYRVMITAYGADLATSFGRRVRDELDYINSAGLTRTTLKPDSQRADEWYTTEGGGMLCAGVAGPITGRGADVLLIDDYLKNAKDAASVTIRDDIWDWFVSTAFSRLEPGGSVVIVATRWNVDDLIGRLDELQPGLWTHVKFPAIATEDNDVLGRRIGDPLWPERYDLDRLSNIREVLGEYFWQALYQQAPIPPGAGLIQSGQLVVIDTVPADARLELIRCWDLAGSPDKGDYTVGVLLGYDRKSGITYLLDVRRGQFGPSKVEELIKLTAEFDGTAVKILIEQEPGSSGKMVAEYLVTKLLAGFNARAERVTGDKFTRAQPLFARIQAGYVRMLRAPWNKPFTDELIKFPEGEHDDQVDAASGAYNALAGKKLLGVTWGRRSSGIYAPVTQLNSESAATTLATLAETASQVNERLQNLGSLALGNPMPAGPANKGGMLAKIGQKLVTGATFGRH